MSQANIPPMKARVHTLPRTGERRTPRRRDQRMSRPIPRGGGRAWINGREVGGPDSRYSHLSSVYD